MSNTKLNAEVAPTRLFVQKLSGGSVVAYKLDPREVHGNGKPVYEYVLESALTAAQSSLAKVVLDEVNKSAWPTANHDVGAHDVEDCTTCAAAMQATEVAKAVRGLFTRLNVPIGE